MLQEDQRPLTTGTAAQGPPGWGYSSQWLCTQRMAGLCRVGVPAELAQQGSGLPQIGTWRPWGCPCRLSSTVLFLPLALSTCCTDHDFLSDQ